MGRRNQADDGELLEAVLELALASPVAGLVVGGLFIGGGLWLRTVPFDFKGGWHIVAPIMGIAFPLIGIAAVLVSVAGLIRNLIRSR